jgi:hypothetical protein
VLWVSVYIIRSNTQGLGSLCPRAVVQILVVVERWRCGVSACLLLHMLVSTDNFESGEQAEVCRYLQTDALYTCRNTVIVTCMIIA